MAEMETIFTVKKLTIASILWFGLRLAEVQPKILVEFFVFEIVSCSPGWPGSYIIKDLPAPAC